MKFNFSYLGSYHMETILKLMPTVRNKKYESCELIESAAAGDLNAFKLLVDQFSGYAYGLSFRLLLNGDDAKDAAQEAFIRVWKHLKEYNPEIKFTTWLYKIVVNLCYDKIKYEKRKKMIFEYYSGGDAELMAAASPGTEEAISNNDSARIIEHIAGGLPPKQRMVFILRDLQNLPADEVAKILNMPVGSVRTNLFYARKLIASKFSKIDRRDIK